MITVALSRDDLRMLINGLEALQPDTPEACEKRDLLITYLEIIPTL